MRTAEHNGRLRKYYHLTPQGLARIGFRNALDLKEHTARLHHRNPILGRALAGAHSGLGRLFGDRLVRENLDPNQ